jgi:hypothetical protein
VTDHDLGLEDPVVDTTTAVFDLRSRALSVPVLSDSQPIV